MSWVDAVFILLLLTLALRGWQVGAVGEIAAMAGLWIGLLVGVLLVPPLAGLVSGGATAVVALLVIFFSTALLGGLGLALGANLRLSLARVHLQKVDSALGVVVGLMAGVLVVWVVGTVLSASQYPSLNRALRGSAVLRAADRVLPPLPDLFARVESFLAERGYPIVFANLPPGVVAPSTLPTSIQAAYRVAAPSTVKVVGRACDTIESGSGFVVAPGVVLTNAHVVAGETSTTVLDAAGGHPASVVLFDAHLDVAVLEVPGLRDPALAIRNEPVARGTTGAIVGYPGGGSLSAAPAAVNARIEAVGLDIYGTAVTTRSVYELHGDVVSGDSGGPLVASGETAGTSGIRPGTVIGVVFAKSSTAANVGYALTMGAVSDDIALAESAAGPVSTGACLP